MRPHAIHASYGRRIFWQTNLPKHMDENKHQWSVVVWNLNILIIDIIFLTFLDAVLDWIIQNPRSSTSSKHWGQIVKRYEIAWSLDRKIDTAVRCYGGEYKRVARMRLLSPSISLYCLLKPTHSPAHSSWYHSADLTKCSNLTE
jgi:hypothetical protein